MSSPNKIQSRFIGKYFHSLDSAGKIVGQGRVEGRVEPGLYLCLHYEWSHGDPIWSQLYAISQMGSWRFYESAEEMDFFFQRQGGFHAQR